MNELETLIRAKIESDGPMPVAEYMELALGHPEHGYYIKGDPFGVAGDFTTAPEISQVFGELIGMWAAVTWQQMGSPDRTILIECGPGRGTLMSDALRAAASVPTFAQTIQVHLLETSPALRAHQTDMLSTHDPAWHDTIETIPPGPTILIANEFLDALPVRQVIRTDTGWAERCVALTDEGLCFEAGRDTLDINDAAPRDLRTDDILEFNPAAMSFVDILSARLSSEPGAALFVDYGYERQAAGDTLQAVRRHGFADPLEAPGEADLTAHVDFGTLAARAAAGGCAVFGPVSQAAFLRSLGIAERTAALLQNADPEQANSVYAGTQRLIDPAAMGTLFKALAITHDGAATPAGFETHSVSGTRRDD